MVLFFFRFWYENPTVFNPEQVQQIKQSSLARVICDSSDEITHVQQDVFHMVNSREDYVSCNNIPKMDLKMWSDCCMGNNVFSYILINAQKNLCKTATLKKTEN